MKVRCGFISNSSSSSFVVIDYASNKFNKLASIDDNVIEIGECGEVEFGWGPCKITDIFSRINLAAIIIKEYMPVDIIDEYWKLLEKVIFANTSYNAISYNKIKNGQIYAYVDHQSVSGMREDIFKSEDSLRTFIFGSNSYIQLDNDNH